MAARKKASMKTVGIVVRPNSRGAVQRARRAAEWLGKRGVTVLAHRDWAGRTPRHEVVDRKTMMRRADLVIVLGGDGSLLGVARLSGPRPVPVVGIHHGDFGFLTDAAGGDLFETLKKVLSDDCLVQQRTMLEVKVRRGGRVLSRAQALNDVVVARGSLSRMLTLEVSIDDEFLSEYLGDGLIVATPTGSTAYSLSAGGPVVEPTMNAMVVTPISPHTLSSRPVVVPDKSTVSICATTDCDDAALTVDGQESFPLEPDDVVEITKSRNRAAIMSVSTEGFFGILRRKLHWGVRGDGDSRRRG